MNPHALTLAALLVVVGLVAGCGSSSSSSASTIVSSAAATATPLVTPSGPGAAPTATPGGTNEPPTPGPTPSPAESTTGGPVPTPVPTPASRLSLTTAAFHVNGVIPAKFTCDGRDVSPAMAWTGTPAGTKWLVLLVDDIDAGDFTHWIAYAISPGTTRLAEGAGAANSTQLAQGTNDFGRVGYGGPCPPSGTHHYVFTLYALAAPLGLDGSPNGAAVHAALAHADVLGKTSISATYSR
jgi:Raf kinase inhibitor-like YbhB/YbcL family protein